MALSERAVVPAPPGLNPGELAVVLCLPGKFDGPMGVALAPRSCILNQYRHFGRPYLRPLDSAKILKCSCSLEHSVVWLAIEGRGTA